MSAVPPQISPFSSGNQPVHLGQYITYQCTITEGDLPLNILWTFNKQPIVSSDDSDIVIAKLGRRSSVLTIESVTDRNAGNYTCQGSNKAGKSSYTTQLKVIGYILFYKFFCIDFCFRFFFCFIPLLLQSFLE